jgi:hypothetical protein
MRTSWAWALVAGVGIAITIAIGMNAGRSHDQASRPTASTTAAAGAAAEFARLNKERGRILAAWDRAQSAPFATFRPVSTRVLSEEARIRDRATAAARACETVDEDHCRLLDALGKLVDHEWTRLVDMERAKRLGLRAEA